LAASGRSPALVEIDIPMHALWGWRFTADVFNEPQSDTDSMRLRREIQFPAQVFPNLTQHAREIGWSF
jgi:hypothetical protein